MQNQPDFDPLKVLFFDIETAPLYKTTAEMPEELRQLYLDKNAKKKKKAVKPKPPEDESEGHCPEEIIEENFGGTGLSAEFGKVICISVGKYKAVVSDDAFEVRSFASDNETQVLQEFSEFLLQHPDYKLCAHNGKGFNLPFLGRRYLIQRIPLPTQLDLKGKKPWEIPHFDTMELWNFGSRQNGESLKLLCAVFGIPSPKDDIDGSQVAGVFYNDRDLNRIVTYCEKDVKVLAQVYNRIVSN